MNIYDFDNTIYDGDSSIDFTLFCFKNYPKTRRYVMKQLNGVRQYAFGKIEKTEMKEKLFSYLQGLDDLNVAVNVFWKQNQKKIKLWYLEQKTDDDLIISASPYFLIRPMCEKLNVSLLASMVDEKSGEFLSLNCYGTEKVRRLREKYLLAKVQNLYSDSYSDQALADIADTAYMVKGENCILWENYRPSKKERMREMFVNLQFILFVFCGCINVFNGIFFAWLYSLFLPANLAFCIGYITSLIISYFMNSVITFHKNMSMVRFVKFAISYIPNFIIQNIIVLLIYNLMSLPELLAYGMAAVVGVPVTFVMIKVFAFSK